MWPGAAVNTGLLQHRVDGARCNTLLPVLHAEASVGLPAHTSNVRGRPCKPAVISTDQSLPDLQSVTRSRLKPQRTTGDPRAVLCFDGGALYLLHAAGSTSCLDHALNNLVVPLPAPAALSIPLAFHMRTEGATKGKECRRLSPQIDGIYIPSVLAVTSNRIPMTVIRKPR